MNPKDATLLLGILACFSVGFTVQVFSTAHATPATPLPQTAKLDRAEEMRQEWARLSKSRGWYDTKLFKHFALFHEYDRQNLFDEVFGPVYVQPLGVDRVTYEKNTPLLLSPREDVRSRTGRLNLKSSFTADSNQFQLMGLYVLGELRIVYGKQSEFPLSFGEWAHSEFLRQKKRISLEKLNAAAGRVHGELRKGNEKNSRSLWPLVQAAKGGSSDVTDGLIGFVVRFPPGSVMRPGVHLLRKGDSSALDQAVAELESTERAIRARLAK